MINCEQLFQIPLIAVDINDWKNKKNTIIELFEDYPEKKIGIQNFHTNKEIVDAAAMISFTNIFNDELKEIANYFKKDITLASVWTVTYEIGDYQTVHNHGSIGLTGIIYLDHNEHSPKTMFVQPWNDCFSDRTIYGNFDDIEGKMILVPSFVNHFSGPVIEGKKRIISFDLKI